MGMKTSGRIVKAWTRFISIFMTIVLLISISTSMTFTVGAATASKLKVNFLNVGQGDSIFIELPNKQTMLIDAGNNDDGNTILNYIKTRGYKSLTYVVATHPHADHIGGFPVVFSGTNVKNFYMPKVSTTTYSFTKLLKAVKNEGCGIKTAKAGVYILNTSSLKILIVAPVESKYDELNDYSAIIKLSYGSKSFLFAGDAESISEGQIKTNINTDVLKIGHHGSSTATTPSFLEKVTPKYAVISCGNGNCYGHPHSATLKKLKNINVYRTDIAGTIIFTCDGKTISVNKSPSLGKAGSSKTVNTTKTANTTKVSSTPISQTVYITETGEKYHCDGCRYLNKSRISISLAEAKRKNYTPCSICNPPS